MADFGLLQWTGDGFALAGYDYKLQHGRSTSTSDNAFVFYKTRAQVAQFERFFDESGLEPKQILELGIWDGGSVALWCDLLHPERYDAIDLQTRGDSSYYLKWLADRSDGVASTHWGVGQGDRRALLDLVGTRRLDLVLDDCSHQLKVTRQSFEVLFPRLRPGGWYVVEDWAWALQPEFQARDHQWATYPALHPLAFDLLRLHGSQPDVIPHVSVFPDFIAVERGSAALETVEWKALINRRQRPAGRIVVSRLKEAKAWAESTLRR